MTLILCLVAFWFGRSQTPPTYYQNPLAVDLALLTTLRVGDKTNTIQRLEAIVDYETLDAIRHRPSLQGRQRQILDKTLQSVARYRERYPRPIDISTNGMPPALIKQAETQISERQQVDAFLRTFVVTNEQPPMRTNRSRVK